MRTRSAVISLLSLAVASIAWPPPPATAAPPEATVQVQGEPVDPSALIVDFAKTPAYFIVVKVPVMLRLTQAVDSTGHQVLVVEGRRLPNPAQLDNSAKPAHAQRYTGLPTDSAGRIGFDSGNYAERLTYHPLPFPTDRSDRHARQRFSSGLRAAAAIGTLFSTGRIRS